MQQNTQKNVYSMGKDAKNLLKLNVQAECGNRRNIFSMKLEKIFADEKLKQDKFVTNYSRYHVQFYKQTHAI